VTRPLGPDRAEANAAAWDLRTAVHLESSYYALDAFKGGALSLKPPERALLGDPSGLRLLHLQCHFGLDTLSWARLGAEVTGVDISPASIAAATQLAEELGIEAGFVCADVHSLGPLGEPFDVVFSSYGVTCWLSSLNAWAGEVARNLRPGGRFVLVEFHPILELLYPGKVSGQGHYFPNGEARPFHSTGTYTDPSAPVSYWEYRWQHPTSEVIAALLDAGLELGNFREYPYCSYRLCEDLDTYDEGVWWVGDADGLIPYMYSLTARKP
jgi:SAM-dependent methyltransferase